MTKQKLKPIVRARQPREIEINIEANHWYCLLRAARVDFQSNLIVSTVIHFN